MAVTIIFVTLFTFGSLNSFDRIALNLL